MIDVKVTAKHREAEAICSFELAAVPPHSLAPFSAAAQFANMRRFGTGPMVAIHIAVGPNRARRVVERLLKEGQA